jgi:hypothetical protein
MFKNYVAITRNDARELLKQDVKDLTARVSPELFFNSVLLASLAVKPTGNDVVDTLHGLSVFGVVAFNLLRSYERQGSEISDRVLLYRRNVSDYLRSYHGLDLLES